MGEGGEAECRLSSVDGIKCRLSEPQAPKQLLGASARTGELWATLALGQREPPRPWHRGRCSEPRVCGRLPSVWL